MAIVCPIDAQYPGEISALLKPPSSQQVQEYFDQLIKSRKCHGLKVVPNGVYGKGVYADLDFKEGDLLLKDPMLVGAQHSSNKIDCLVCSYCFHFIGSIELQIGRKLFLQGLGDSADVSFNRHTFSHGPKDCFQSDSSDVEGTSDHDNLGKCASSSSGTKKPLSIDVVEALMNGDMILPYSEQFPLPSIISCPGGCREAYYCSKLCADADWDLFHCLLCTGERSKSLCKDALLRFIQHANETNDIFLLAAKAISCTILNYRKLKAAHLEQQMESVTHSIADTCDLSLLSEAWKPVSMGYKRRWWDCIALPDDVDCCDEATFRGQIKELAYTASPPTK